jgi:hypothetical protein
MQYENDDYDIIMAVNSLSPEEYSKILKKME